jgi:hypothetical protein
MSLSEQLASRAESIVTSLVHTDYQHHSKIDPDAGIYDCDCAGFVGFILNALAPQHYAKIPKEADQPRPRAFEYYMFFASLSQQAEGWRRIGFLGDARRGDMVSWRFPTIEAHQDTGHVVFVAATPTVDENGNFSLHVYDSAVKPHFDDTRGTEAGKFPNGVGVGTIRLKVDADGRPIAFLFAPPDTAQFSYLPIAIGRAEA